MKQRIISAAVLLAIFIPILFIGGLPFSLLMTLLSSVGLYELLRVRKTKKNFPFFMEIISYLLVMFFVITNYTGTQTLVGNNLSFYMDYRIIAILIFAYIMPIVFINDNKKYNLNDSLFLIGSTLFVGVSFSLLNSLRDLNLSYIIYIFLIATITDTFALFTGSKIGKNKLAPDISPKKTIEGAIGGSIMGTIVASVYFIEVSTIHVNSIFVIFMTLILTVIGQIGDLTFSAIKRYYKTKDFSNLIPGHGGILDRLDSIIFIVLGFLMFLSIL